MLSFEVLFISLNYKLLSKIIRSSYTTKDEETFTFEKSKIGVLKKIK